MGGQAERSFSKRSSCTIFSVRRGSCSQFLSQMSYLHSETTVPYPVVRALLGQPKLESRDCTRDNFSLISTLPFRASEAINSLKNLEASGDLRETGVYGPPPGAGFCLRYTALAGAYKIMHLVPFSFLGLPVGRGFKTALVAFSTQAHSAYPTEQTHLIASSKTLFRFLCVNAEHSRYLWARMSLDTASACSYETASIRFDRNASIVPLSSLKSSFVPTNMIGTFGAWCSISGNHFALTLSKDGGLTMEKQMRNTSVCGYDSGRRRS